MKKNNLPDVKLIELRHRISDGVKGDLRMLDHKCSGCGVGINKNDETFIIMPTNIIIWCKQCSKHIEEG